MNNSKPARSDFIRYFIIEVIIYGVLISLYFYFVLRLLGDWLVVLQGQNLFYYAFVSLGLILVQGMVLDIVSGYLAKLFSQRMN